MRSDKRSIGLDNLWVSGCGTSVSSFSRSPLLKFSAVDNCQVICADFGFGEVSCYGGLDGHGSGRLRRHKLEPWLCILNLSNSTSGRGSFWSNNLGESNLKGSQREGRYVTGRQEGRSCFWATDARTVSGSALARKVVPAEVTTANQWACWFRALESSLSFPDKPRMFTLPAE